MKLSETERKLEALIQKTTTQKQKSSELLKEADGLRDQAEDLDNKCLRWDIRKEKIKINLLKHFYYRFTSEAERTDGEAERAEEEARRFKLCYSNFFDKLILIFTFFI